MNELVSRCGYSLVCGIAAVFADIVSFPAVIEAIRRFSFAVSHVVFVCFSFIGSRADMSAFADIVVFSAFFT